MKPPFRVGLLIFGIVLVLLLVCGGLYGVAASFAPIAAQDLPTQTQTPFLPATRTPTPFLPASSGGGAMPGEDSEAPPPLPVFSPTPNTGVAPWAPYAGPIYPADTPIPSPARVLSSEDDIFSVALLGMDLRPGGSSYRTDTIMILTVNRTKKTAALISFPRDLYVYIPAYGMNRINTAFPLGQTIAYPGGNLALFQDMMKYNFGLPVDHYVLVNFSGFTAMINALGGVDVSVASTYTDKRGKTMYTVYAGVTHMDGDTALWYARARYASNDFDRERRQQEVMVAIMQRLLSLNVLADLPGIYNTLRQYVESDISLDMITPYADLATQMTPSDVRRFAIVPPDHVTSWTNFSGAMVQIPNYPAIRALIETALNP